MTVTAAAPGAGSPALRLSSARGHWVVAATVLGSGMAALDATVVGIALPAIGRDFHASVSSVQWVVDAYTLTLAGLLLLGGTLGDSYGRRKLFVIGVVWFAIASLLCGLALNAPMLIAARALQGVGGALLTPGSLAILQASFAEEDRGAAIGAWSGLGGVATAIGPFLGGWLIDAVSWRLVFFINLPLAVLVVAIAARHVPETKSPGPVPKLDIRGALCISGALAGITYGLIAASTDGWGSVQVVAPLVAGAVLFGLFILTEAREKEPMLPLEVFASRQFSAANAVTFVVYAALGGLLFLVPTVLQVAHGYSPVEAGTALLPVTVIMLALSSRSGALAARIGPRLQMTVGPLVIAASLLLFTRLGSSGDYLDRGAASGGGVRPRRGHQRGPADRDRPVRGPGRARRDRLGGQQRRRPGGRPDRGSGAARAGRHHRRQLPASGPSSPTASRWQPSLPRCSARPAACSPGSRSATRHGPPAPGPHRRARTAGLRPRRCVIWDPPPKSRPLRPHLTLGMRNEF